MRGEKEKPACPPAPPVPAPLDDEEVWWAQDPVKLPLKKGANTIDVEQPYVGEFQSWGVSLIPLFRSLPSHKNARTRLRQGFCLAEASPR